MRWIVLSVITIMTFAVGANAVAAFCGAAPDVAIGASILGAVLAYVITAFVTIDSPAGFGALAAAIAAIVYVFSSFIAEEPSPIIAVSVAGFATAIALLVAKEHGLKRWRVLTAFLLEAGTIIGALSAGAGWGVPIAVIGVIGLAALGYASRDDATSLTS